MKPVVISAHALQQMSLRGALEEEVEAAIALGEKSPARVGRIAFRKNFTFRSVWKGRYYEMKQVMPVVVEEADATVVVTVYVFYFGGQP